MSRFREYAIIVFLAALFSILVAVLVQYIRSGTQEPKGQPIVSPLKDAFAPCPEEANLAVLNKLFPVVGTPHAVSKQWLDQEDTKLACIREWAKSLTDPCMRYNYLDWLSFYSNRSKEWRAALDAGVDLSKDDYTREREEKERRVQLYEDSHKIPIPPLHCETGLIRKVK
jgi:hypothetical protein